MTIRDDIPFLEEMQFEVFFWNPNTPRPPADEFLARSEIQKLVAGWGRPGNHAVVAQEGETPIGAAWYRFRTEEDHTYGLVDADTPEAGRSCVRSSRRPETTVSGR